MTATITAPETRVFVACGRCGGLGSLPCYGHIDRGICYECEGGRGVWSTQEAEDRKAARREKAAEKRAAKRAAEEAEKAAKAAAWTAEHAETVKALDTLKGSFGESLREALETFGSLTEGQEAAVLRIAAEEAVKAAQPVVPVIEGRVTITGTVLATKVVETYFGGRETPSFKMTVADDRGFRVFGTIPTALLSSSTRDEAGEWTTTHSVDKGDRVTFTAQVERSRDDETFGFYKRPTKAERV